MTTPQIISMLFGSGLVFSVGGFLVGKYKAIKSKYDALALGLQALLRDRLLESYNHYSKKGYAPIYAKENFENMYKQYHSLGVNGVMDDIHAKFLALPDSLEDDE